ncbi:MAG TPA: CHAT domain-containing tetratricopeptide repeat protein [Blastocatellia bacterium]|nr:CHAT domain-containing tetratricopeptide repeat protein [Blastocatellia bacterium]
MAGGQSTAYRLALASGQAVRVVVDQRGIDVIVKLSGPDGQPITEYDAEIRTTGPETVSWVADEWGTYRLEVLAKQKNAAAGRFEILVMETRAANDNDRSLFTAHKLIANFIKLFRAGKYDEALPLVERALEIRQKVLGPEHPEVAAALTGLANCYRGKGEYGKADPLYQRALAIREKALEADHPDLAASLINLANLYNETSQFMKAESYYQRALSIYERALGPEHPLVGLSLNNLAALYLRRGDYAKAEPLYRRSLSIGEKVLGPEHPNVGSTLTNLALLYYFRGDYAQAEPLYRRALAIKEKVLGPDHPSLAYSLNDLARLYSDRGDYDQAEPLYRRALSILEKSLGPDHPDVATALHYLASLYRKKGDFAKAEPSHQRALAIIEKALGPEHQRVSEFLNDLAVFYAVKGDLTRSMAYLARANAVGERNLRLNLDIGSERQKLAYLSLYSKETNLTLSLHSQNAPNDPRALELAFTTLLRRKARGLDAMTDTIATLRRHATPQNLTLFDQLTEARSQLASLSLKESGAGGPDETYRTRLKSLEDLVEDLEKELSQRSSEFSAQAQTVTLSTVQAALPAGTALIEFTICTPLEAQTEKSRPPRYLAYLLTAERQPKWVDLGESGPIDQAVEEWRRALRDPNRPDVNLLARIVDQKVMQPVRAALQSGTETRRLLIAPDGLLNLIPFAALVDEQNQFLVNRYAISYLTSGRDLLRLQPLPPNQMAPTVNAPLVMANPVFGRVATIPARAEQSSRSSRGGSAARTQIDSSQVFFQPLPGTEEEALAIKAVLPEASVLLREQATEAALKRARAPRIMHIATHGFFLNEQESTVAETRGLSGAGAVPTSERPVRDFFLALPTEMLEEMAENQQQSPTLRLSKWAAYVENPLLRSGLALAGANQGKSGEDDGVLTALEAAGLDLWGTKLVVLSACDTGVGEVKNGEGVQGLRRALVLAGSESQVMSLWPVPDAATKELMGPYYQALQRGQGRSEGLRQVQLTMLRNKLRQHPFYWAAFIQSGEWANLDGQR